MCKPVIDYTRALARIRKNQLRDACTPEKLEAWLAGREWFLPCMVRGSPTGNVVTQLCYDTVPLDFIYRYYVETNTLHYATRHKILGFGESGHVVLPSWVQQYVQMLDATPHWCSWWNRWMSMWRLPHTAQRLLVPYMRKAG